MPGIRLVDRQRVPSDDCMEIRMQPEFLKQAAGQVFNCCAAHATRGQEFADIVERLSPGIHAAFGFPWSMAQGGEIEFSMDKMKSLLDFEPQYTLGDAVQSIYDWVQAGGLER